MGKGQGEGIDWKFSLKQTLTLTAEQHSRLLTLEDLAKILGMSVETLRSWPSKYPHRLPPRTYVAGADLVRFNPSDVEKWINSQNHLETETIDEKRYGRKRNPRGI